MTKWMRGLIALLLAGVMTSAAACGDTPEKVDSSSTPDAGAPEAFVDRAERHTSYVPDGYKPVQAARLIVIGDSISAGAGASKNSLAYFGQLLKNDDTKYPDELSASLTAKFGETPELVNVAVGGATTNDLPKQEAALAKQAPFSGHSIVTITIGGNDLQGALAGNDPNPGGDLLTEALNNIRPTIEFLQDPEKFPDGTSIYLMAVYDPTDGEGQANGCFFGISRPQFIPALDQWREGYINLAKEKRFAVVDALGHFHGHGANSAKMSNDYYYADDPTRWFANDCIHPNERGHSELRRLFFEAIDWNYTATP